MIKITPSGMVILDANQFALPMPQRFTIKNLFGLTFFFAVAIVISIRFMQPARSVRIQNDSNSPVKMLTADLFPFLPKMGDQSIVINRSTVAPGETVIIRHDIEYPSLTFSYEFEGETHEYSNLNLFGHRDHTIKIGKSGRWLGAGISPAGGTLPDSPADPATGQEQRAENLSSDENQ
ncbi:MAG: hypothetical protein GY818_18175 [Planctomycetaceae bacterium]|nr:hypothetical protein [Planctomycetaceae bacterium]